jgi:hypothetical protein
MTLPGPLAAEFHVALLDAYSEDELAQVVHFALDARLPQVAGGSNFAAVAHNLLLWAERQGRTGELVEAVGLSRPLNPAVREFLAHYYAGETAYLHDLIAKMEARPGVQEYVALAGEFVRQEQREKPGSYDEWGFDELVAPQAPAGAALTPPAAAKERGSLAEIIMQQPRLVLLGRPGAGKTTTLRRLARDLAQQRLADRAAPLPKP